MDKLTIIIPIIIISFVVSFALWVLLHKDKEADAQQLYLTLQDIKKREADIIKDSVIPALKKATNRFTLSVNRERLLRNPSDVESSESDIVELTEKHFINLINAEMLENTLQADKYLRKYRNRLNILKATFMNSDLEESLNGFSQKRLEYLSVDSAFKVARECWKLDKDTTLNLMKITQLAASEMRKMEKNVVERLNSLIKENIKEKEYEPNRNYL